ncbi:MAG: acetylxylan esterase [Planctomycetes bacterium]|nr:acetylxylan esterase [Planctomycetota bacterium]
MFRCTVLVLCLFSGKLIAESLPLLTADKSPQSVEELWATYDPNREPLDVHVVREWTEGGCAIKYIIYAIGTFKGEKSTMAAFYAAPEKPQGKIPALIQMHGGGQRAMIASAKYGAENGYACLSINWGGREMEGAQSGDPTTDWGAVDATQTGHNSHYGSLAPDHLTLDPFESPRNNNWFLITLAAKRGVSFLQQQPEVDGSRIGAFGHSMGGFLTVMLAGADKRIKAGVPSCGGSGSAPDIIRNRPNSGVRRRHSELYHKTIDDAQYIKQINVPMLYMGPQNDFNGILDSMYENWKSMPSEHIGYTVNPHMNHRATAEHVFPGMLWFDAHLKGTFDFPRTPALTVSLRSSDGVPTASLVPDQIDKVAKVDIYYSVDNHILSRFWRSAPAQETEGTWQAALPVTSTDQPLYVLANVYYTLNHEVIGYPWMREAPNTFGITTKMRSFAPDDLRSAEVRGDEARERVVQAEFDYQDWYQLNWENPHWWCAYTRKIKDPRFIGPDGAGLAMDIQVDHDTSLAVHVRNNSWGAYPGKKQGDYYAPVTVKGSPDWQTVRVELSDFVPENSRTTEPLTRWRYITELGLCGHLKVEKDGKILEVPENAQGETTAYGIPRKFRNLRWVGGSYSGLPASNRSAAEENNAAAGFEDDEFQKAIENSIALEKMDEQAAHDGKVYLIRGMASKIESYWRVLDKDKKVFLDSYAEARVHDPKVKVLRDKVKLIVHPEWMLPGISGHDNPVKIRLKDGREFSKVCTSADVSMILDVNEVLEKYMDCALRVVSKSRADEIADLVLNLEKVDDIGKISELATYPDK